jgi:hypothetical protein
MAAASAAFKSLVTGSKSYYEESRPWERLFKNQILPPRSTRSFVIVSISRMPNPNSTLCSRWGHFKKRNVTNAKAN